MKLVERFLIDLAGAWDREERPRLQVLGSTALMRSRPTSCARLCVVERRHREPTWMTADLP